MKSWIQAANHTQLGCTINLEYHMLIINTNLIIINRVSEDELLQVRSIHHCELLYHTHPEERGAGSMEEPAAASSPGTIAGGVVPL